MSKALVMNFLDELGHKSSIKVSNVKEGLTETEVKGVMDAVISNNIFQSKGLDLVQKDSAHITDTEVTELF